MTEKKDDPEVEGKVLEDLETDETDDVTVKGGASKRITGRA